ncbi:hypothetical protein AJ78_00512 [Emergomyces pasteurianus Ep9510]|uniref:Uncharacterized protein n=1 Tax=Emergomyces pasteurianus Ep9510 TaxID=1447872 RepID=A0A1J9QW63_9EURO|nr:hypothetical protein AJ78_00512 [Emergomyces pasteurianus Ep9510]
MSSSPQEELHFIPLHSRSTSDHLSQHNIRNAYHPVPSSSDPLDRTVSPPIPYQDTGNTPGSQTTSTFGLGIDGHNSLPHESSPEIKRDTSHASNPLLMGHIPQHHSISSNSTFDNGNNNSAPDRQRFNCPSAGSVRHKRASWLTITILVLAFYSTAFSGLYMIVAFIKPRYGSRIGRGSLAPDTASLLSALFAKTIELSFVTVFVAFLGQVLSRRALAKRATGISIADMSMRGWIMQPGSLITHWQHVRHSGLTALGMIALTATLMALLYTTAADALVSPKLSYGPQEIVDFTGTVKTKFANVPYLLDECLTPVPNDADPEHGKGTCLQLSYVGQAYHNYREYISEWSQKSRNGDMASTDMSYRIVPAGTWNDNTTLRGSWIHEQNMVEVSKKHGRMINNVTAAMPHAGIIAASRHPHNSLRQPDDFNGLGEFALRASVVSPVVNVLCAGMTEKEIAPLVYNEWPEVKGKVNVSTWLSNPPEGLWAVGERGNKTVVDDIFEFSERKLPPIFPKLPVPFNTLVNGTLRFHIRDSLYILLASPPYITDPPFALCAIKAGVTTQCSTNYRATASGGNLAAICDDPADNMRYNKDKQDMPLIEWDENWEDMSTEWANSLSLGTGITDGHASNTRLLTQLIPPLDPKTNTYSLSQTMPSVAEAFAAMAASTLLMASEGANFDLERPDLSKLPLDQTFKASLRVSDYSSGGAQKWQGIFYVVLVLVFLTNLVCLGYMYLEIKGEQLTDFTEPQNMFALALNSAGSTKLSGACGAGPVGAQLSEPWIIGMDEETEHYFITSKAEKAERMLQELAEQRLKPAASPAVKEYRRISQNRSSISMFN